MTYMIAFIFIHYMTLQIVHMYADCINMYYIHIYIYTHYHNHYIYIYTLHILHIHMQIYLHAYILIQYLYMYIYIRKNYTCNCIIILLYTYHKYSKYAHISKLLPRHTVPHPGRLPNRQFFRNSIAQHEHDEYHRSHS